MMDHKGTRRIETPRLILRRFREDDIEKANRNWFTDPEVTRYLTWQPHESMEASQAIVHKWMDQYQDTKFYQWVICLKETDEPIGSISAVRVRDDVGEVEVGYCIGKQWWHQYYTTEALMAVMDFFFASVHVLRVCARHDVENEYSGMVMRKCAMRYEGTIRQTALNNRGIVDLDVYGMLSKEYFMNQE